LEKKQKKKDIAGKKKKESDIEKIYHEAR